ncbi:MAG: hypothetical protein ACXVIG_07080 [Halobacteriota archaeon]
MTETDDVTQRITALEEQVEDLQADIGRLMMILRSDVIEGVAIALDDIQALMGVLAHNVPSIADALQPVHDTNDSARSALQSSEVFKWVIPSGEEFSKE